MKGRFNGKPTFNMQDHCLKGTLSQAMKDAPAHDMDSEVNNESLQVAIVISQTYDLQMHMTRREEHELQYNARSGVNIHFPFTQRSRLHVEVLGTIRP